MIFVICGIIIAVRPANSALSSADRVTTACHRATQAAWNSKAADSPIAALSASSAIIATAFMLTNCPANYDQEGVWRACNKRLL
jgi:hypothetical protein